MSDKDDLAADAALRALKNEKPRSKKTDKAKTSAKSGTGAADKDTAAQKSNVYPPRKGSADAEAERQAAEASAKSTKSARTEPKAGTPEKGAAEAAAHNEANDRKKMGKAPSSGSSDSERGNIGFLLTALAAPLILVVGLFGYASYKDTQTQKPQQTAAAPGGDKSTNVRPAASPMTAAETAPAVPAPANTAPSAAATPTATEKSAEVQGGGDKPGWSYEGETGPAKWASLSPAYAACGNGKMQSPVDVPQIARSAGPGFQYDYRASGGKIINNGHTIKVELPSGNRLLVNGRAYDLKQMHFHTPSEHKLGGRGFDMEIHLVHSDAAGNRVVVAVLVERGGVNPLLQQMPLPSPGADNMVATDQNLIDPTMLLPVNRAGITFSGSLTTPPCTENVGWVVMRTPIHVTGATIDKFKQAMGANNRPLQALNDRGFFSAN